MAAITQTSLPDFLADTLQDFTPGEITDLTVPDGRQQCIMLSWFFKKALDLEDFGDSMEVHLDTATLEPGRMVGYYHQGQSNTIQGVKVGLLPAKIYTKSWGIDEIMVDLNDPKKVKIIDIRDREEKRTRTTMALDMENLVWDASTYAADTVNNNGVLNYIVDGSGEGFTGGNASGWDDGNIFDSDAITSWKNYYNTWTGASYTGLIEPMELALDSMEFKSPTGDAALDVMMGTDMLFIVTGFDGKQNLKRIARSQNQTLGFDVAAPGDGSVVVNGHKVIQMSKLTAQDYFFLNLNHLRLKVKKGWYFKRKIEPAANQPTTTNVHYHLVFNVWCDNRRALGKLKAA